MQIKRTPFTEQPHIKAFVAELHQEERRLGKAEFYRKFFEAFAQEQLEQSMRKLSIRLPNSQIILDEPTLED